MTGRVASLQRRMRRVRRLIAHAESDANDARALQALAPLSGTFLPWTPFSMRPAAILAIVSDIAVNDRQHVLECGSGNSTVYIARLLAIRGMSSVHLCSIEHDRQWAETTKAMLVREGLQDWVTLTVAPLVDGWYDARALPATESIDLLVVDGPPAHEAAHLTARAPALSHFGRRLAEGATVLLDDAEREGERQVLAEWEREWGLRFRIDRGGYAIATR